MARFVFGVPLTRLVVHVVSPQMWCLFLGVLRDIFQKKSIIHILGLVAVFWLTSVVHAQVQPGFPSWTPMDCHDIDCVNLANGNIILSAPVMQKAGSIPFALGVVANSYAYVSQGEWTLSFGGPAPNYGLAPQINGGRLGVLVGEYAIGYTCPGGGNGIKFYNITITDQNGTVHALPSSDYVLGGACISSLTDRVVDGTGYTLSATGTSTDSLTTTVYDRSGNALTSTSVTDVHGNRITQNRNGTWTDSLGLQVASSTGNPPTLSWTDLNGGAPQMTTSLAFHYWHTVFGCSGIYDLNVQQLNSFVGAINFPDGTSIGVGYEATPGFPTDITGRLGSLTTRQGGTISYTYSGSNNGMNCTYKIPPTMKRQTSDGTTEYDFAPTSSGVTTTVIDQGGNKTVFTFVNSSPNDAPVLTQVVHYQGGSTPLTTDTYCYNGNLTNCATAAPSMPISERDIFHQINGMSGPSRVQQRFDTYGNSTYSAQYDFGGTAPTRSVTTTYGSCSANCTAATPTISAIGSYINDRPGRIVATQNGSAVAESRFTYNSQGNVITIYQWTGSRWLSNPTANAYNSNGTPSDTYDFAGNHTQYSYSAAGYSGCGSCTQYPFPTSINHAGSGLITSATWNGTGGVKLTDKDASGNTTTYGYASSGGTADPFWRLMSVTDPLNSVAYKTYTATSANSNFSFNSGASLQNTTITTDGYGRPINAQTHEGPSASLYDTASTAYGWPTNYKAVATSQPCATTSGSRCSTVHTNYMDPLGRLYQESTTSNETLTHTYTQNDDLAVLTPAPSGENSKQVQRQYDGLGRVTKSCAIGNGSTTACGQNTGSANGVTTSTSYTSGTGYQKVSSTRGSQTRSTTVDGLSRVTQKVTPEGGTWNYYYDSSYSSCPSGYTGAAGKLEAVLDPDGNKLCYKYDSLSRVTGVNANGTACRHFYYDNSTGYSGSIPSGVSTPTNPYGRMVEAVTDSCSSGTLITDEWFSYDKDGHVTDTWEKTPHSGTYYHSVVTFAGNGAPLTVQLANPNLYTMTYGLDGEGRPSTLIGNSTTVVSGTTFNASGQPTYIDLGTGTDQSDYVYDPNTGRMTHWTFQVGSTGSETGTLTWNANGTLRQLAIVDGFNSGGTQTCNFGTSTVMGYDDLGRLLSDNCGSVWAQTFSYDQYDNITKSGSISWNPGYNPANNHYSTGANYDNSGNLTYDTIHLYTWNQFGKLSTIDSSTCGTNGECVTYDALGRIVETSYNSAYTEIWYTQLGKVYMTGGSTPYYAYWPTPGKGTAEVNGNAVTFYYMHKDWLGSARISSTITNHTVISDQAYAPYGEVYNKLATGAGVPAQMFTGDTQDIIGGIFDTPNRELNASQGRWLSPDPAGQGWNLYAYVSNEPLGHTDPSGLYFFVRHWNKAFGGGCAGTEEGGICLPWWAPESTAYNVNGADVPSWVGQGLLSSGAGRPCPIATCTTISVDGVLVHYMAYQTGSAWVPYAGPGSTFSANDQALVAGAMYAENQSLLNDGNEQAGMTYKEGDHYTYTAPVEGSVDSSQPLDAMPQIPADGIATGGYHSHGVFDPNYENERFSGQAGDDGGDAIWSSSNDYPLSLATPGGRVMIYYPGPACQTFGLGSPIGTGTTIPICP